MTWKSHKIVTFATVFAATGSFPAAACAALGSVLPDRIEGPMWRHWHRTYSHWFVLYLPFVIVLLPYANVFLDDRFHWNPGSLFFWSFLGALMHIAEDAICGKIPLWSPKKRVQALPRLFYVGSAKEYIFVLCYCAGLIVLKTVSQHL